MLAFAVSPNDIETPGAAIAVIDLESHQLLTAQFLLTLRMAVKKVSEKSIVFWISNRLFNSY